MVISKIVEVRTVSELPLSSFAFSQSNSEIELLRQQIEGLQVRFASLEFRQSIATPIQGWQSDFTSRTVLVE